MTKPTFSKHEADKKGCPEAVAVQCEPVVDESGGEPEVVDDDRLFAHVGRLEEVEEPQNSRPRRFATALVRFGQLEAGRKLAAVVSSYLADHGFGFLDSALGQEPPAKSFYFVQNIKFV